MRLDYGSVKILNIEDILLPGEDILYSGRAAINKGSKGTFGLIVITLFCLLLFIAFREMNQVDGAMIIVGIFMLLIIGIAFYTLIYNFFLKKRKIMGQEYFITTQRAIIYSNKNEEFIIGYLKKFDEFRVDSEKDNFGDLYMGVVAKQDGNIKEVLTLLDNTIVNPDKSDMNYICFESIENPYQVMEIATDQRIKLVPDRPILKAKKEENEIKIGDGKVTIYEQPKWVWFLYSVILIMFFAIPIHNIVNNLIIWSNYTKTSATITNIETRDVGGDDGRDVKYFVKVLYNVDNNNYESVITNDTCYLKSTENFKGYTSHCWKYDSYFRKMRVNSKTMIYVNPNRKDEVSYVPTLLSNSNLLLLIFGILCSLPLVAKIKSKIMKKR